MNYEEALTLLGVGRDADARARRRAYLQRLKQTKPERDPEGFWRLREAYELLERDSPDDDESEPDSTPSAFRVQPMQLQSAPNINPEPQEPVTLEQLAPPQPSLANLIHDAREALAMQDFDSLWQLLDQALDHAETEHPESANLPEYLIIEATLAAFMVGKPEPGRDVFRRWSKLSGSFDVVRAEGDINDQARIVLISELVELPSKFPDEFAALIASALLRGDLDSERVRITELADERPSAAHFARDLLMFHASGLHAIYSASLGDGKPELPDTDWAAENRLYRIIHLAFMLGVGLLIYYLLN